MASSVQNSRVSRSGLGGCCRTCNHWCWKIFKWFPVLLIASIMTWSYYAYIIQLCVFTVENTIQQCVYMVIYHILLIMFAWSYWKTIFAEIKPVPEKYKLPETELEKLLNADSEDTQRSVLESFAKDLPLATRLKMSIKKLSNVLFKQETKKDILENFADGLPVLTRTMSGSVRYCNRCVVIKPDRAHHCSICQKCVLKMDHHCPWVNNCVCFHNYKFFMLFLGYAFVYCLYVMATCMPYFIKFWKMYQKYKQAHCDRLIDNGKEMSNMCMDMINGDFGTAASVGRYHIVFAFFVSLLFAISLGSLFGYHCYLVLNNRTTLEAFRAPMFRGGTDKNGFSLGGYNNFKEVFGNNPNLWLVPVFTSLGDGCEYPVRMEHQLQSFSTPQEAYSGYESMGTTRSSFGDGIVYPTRLPEEESESLLNSEQWERWGEQPRPFDEHEVSSFDEL